MTTFTTVRFGELQVPESEQLEFGRGLLGFEHLKRFVHLEMEEEYPFGWMQSLDDPKVAFVVASPALFFPQYRVEVDPRELGDVRPGPNEKLLVLGICTVPASVVDVTMNLQGPLVINPASRRGKQLVLNHSGYGTQHRLTDSLSEAGQGVVARPPERTRHTRPQRATA
jgi:flagellar assembly factor FliW